MKSKLLDEKVVESAKETLKRVRNNAYVTKKLNPIIVAKKHSIIAVIKICCISKNSIDCMDKSPKI
ncbi:hypothetical protein GO684_04810 [Wolbachia endosymbiont of Litomosoides brasiliensis]|nr:hypothetical protein [Wolbachia endosymbiont of Litomosoides brasiliensis]NUY39914.1 hypothetical protein [Wolbachia endosymbiont of Litomosoides brasiliensis]